MTQETIALLLDDACISIDELAQSCTVSREWVIEHVHAGALLETAERNDDPAHWTFTGRDLLRSRRLFELERTFDANPELAALVADLLDEVNRLRTRMRRAGLSIE
jgi:chaperone modulatory protein CbpM